MSEQRNKTHRRADREVLEAYGWVRSAHYWVCGQQVLECIRGVWFRHTRFGPAEPIDLPLPAYLARMELEP